MLFWGFRSDDNVSEGTPPFESFVLVQKKVTIH